MIKNYLNAALRSMLRKKGYSLINIAGLTLGLACCLVIFQYVAFEVSFDRFHENEGELYRVLQAYASGDEDLGLGAAYSGFALAPTLEAEVPEIRHVARVHPEWDGAIVSPVGDPDRVFEERAAFYVDPAFLEMFTFPLSAGSASMAPGTILLTESAARKYFGADDPLGKVLNWSGVTEKGYVIAGVLDDVPAASHLQFEFLLPMEDLLASENYRNEPEGGWSWNNFATYVQLHSSAEPHMVEAKMTDAYLAHRGDELRELGFRGRLNVQRLRDVHLNAAVVGEPLNAVLGSYRTVYFFTVIGLITLIIALVNYVNLATARALDRSREVGVRKVVGARQAQLIGQFLIESALTIAAAAALAVVLAVALTPLVNDVADLHLNGGLWANALFWAAFLATLAVATLLAGLYPAFVLSSFRPAAVLKGAAGAVGGKQRLRKGLVVAQFAASVVLIGGTVIVYHQLNYMRQMDLGLDLEQVVSVTAPRVLPEDVSRASALSSFLQEVRRIPDVQQAATSSSLPGQGFNWNGASFWRSDEDPASRREGVVTYIDSSFADLYGLERVAGQDFSDVTVPASDDAPFLVMANEKVVRSLGYSSPEDAVGHPLFIGGNDAVIIGVYRNFNWMSGHEELQNIFFGYTPAGLHVSLRIRSADLPATMAAVERVYQSQFPGNVFTYSFLDEAFGRQYRTEERFAALFTFFAGLAVMIACLGLFGLASFTARQRTREISVRKVLGASVQRLVGMLAQDFLKLVLMAMIFGLPLAYFLMQRWLEQFAYRVTVDPGLFLLVGLVVLVLAFVTVAYQSVRAALADPVRSLRSE